MGGRGFWFLALATALVAALADVCRAVSARGLLQKPAVLLAAAEKGEGARVEEDVLVKMQMRMRAEAKKEEDKEKEKEKDKDKEAKKRDVGKELDALLDAHLDDKKNRRRGR